MGEGAAMSATVTLYALKCASGYIKIEDGASSEGASSEGTSSGGCLKVVSMSKAGVYPSPDPIASYAGEHPELGKIRIVELTITEKEL